MINANLQGKPLYQRHGHYDFPKLHEVEIATTQIYIEGGAMP